MSPARALASFLESLFFASNITFKIIPASRRPSEKILTNENTCQKKGFRYFRATPTPGCHHEFHSINCTLESFPCNVHRPERGHCNFRGILLAKLTKRKSRPFFGWFLLMDEEFSFRFVFFASQTKQSLLWHSTDTSSWRWLWGGTKVDEDLFTKKRSAVLVFMECVLWG